MANESQHLLIFGVPKINIQQELKKRVERFGAIEHIRNVTQDISESSFPLEAFTEVYWIKFREIVNARKCKRYLDAKQFYGGILHISYAPEYETQCELRDKLHKRMLEVKHRQEVNSKFK